MLQSTTKEFEERRPEQGDVVKENNKDLRAITFLSETKYNQYTDGRIFFGIIEVLL